MEDKIFELIVNKINGWGGEKINIERKSTFKELRLSALDVLDLFLKIEKEYDIKMNYNLIDDESLRLGKLSKSLQEKDLESIINYVVKKIKIKNERGN